MRTKLLLSILLCCVVGFGCTAPTQKVVSGNKTKVVDKPTVAPAKKSKSVNKKSSAKIVNKKPVK